MPLFYTTFDPLRQHVSGVDNQMDNLLNFLPFFDSWEEGNGEKEWVQSIKQFNNPRVLLPLFLNI